MHHRRIIHKFFLAYCKYKYTIPNLVFNFLKHYRRPRTPLIRLYVRLSQKQPVGLSVRLSQKQPVGSSELKGAKGRLLAGESRRPKAGCFARRPCRLLCWSSSAKTISSSILPIGEKGMNVVQTGGILIRVRNTH